MIIFSLSISPVVEFLEGIVGRVMPSLSCTDRPLLPLLLAEGGKRSWLVLPVLTLVVLDQLHPVKTSLVQLNISKWNILSRAGFITGSDALTTPSVGSRMVNMVVSGAVYVTSVKSQLLTNMILKSDSIQILGEVSRWSVI